MDMNKTQHTMLATLGFQGVLRFTQLQHVHKRVREAMRKKGVRESLSGEAHVEETKIMQESSNIHSTYIATRSPHMNTHSMDSMKFLKGKVWWLFVWDHNQIEKWSLKCALPIVKHV